MNREDEIQKISKRIQRDIDKLKELNCFVSSSYDGFYVFDDNIEPIKTDSNEDDFNKCVVFSFNTTRIITKRKAK